MGKMSELSTVVDELRKCGETLIDIGDTLGGIFGEDVPAPEQEHIQPEATQHEPNTEQTAPWEPTQPEPAQQPTQPAPQPEPPQVTLEQLRSVLAEKSVGGHRAEVQALIREYGADKLSAVDPKYYADMLAKAEVM